MRRSFIMLLAVFCFAGGVPSHGADSTETRQTTPRKTKAQKKSTKKAGKSAKKPKPRAQPAAEAGSQEEPLKPLRRFRYSELLTKDYDEMAQLVHHHILRAKYANTRSVENSEDDSTDQGPAVEALREAMILILSRPDQDNMVAKLMPEVRKELITLNSLEDVMASVSGEAIRGLAGDLPTIQRATFYFVLENFLGEFKPEISEKEEIRRFFEQIRDANLEVPKAVETEIKMRSMMHVSSPSERAAKVLADIPLKPAK